MSPLYLVFYTTIDKTHTHLRIYIYMYAGMQIGIPKYVLTYIPHYVDTGTDTDTYSW